jgi:hypothetical protein
MPTGQTSPSPAAEAARSGRPAPAFSIPFECPLASLKPGHRRLVSNRPRPIDVPTHHDQGDDTHGTGRQRAVRP